METIKRFSKFGREKKKENKKRIYVEQNCKKICIFLRPFSLIQICFYKKSSFEFLYQFSILQKLKKNSLFFKPIRKA